MSAIIKVEKISKQYRLGARQAAYGTLRDTLREAAASPLRRLRGAAQQSGEILWALKDVSFEVEQGEVLGVIGHNGAGKSTLLKILSRITEPTGGRAELYGRIGSLLEVGTGFHPELTGRENIHLSGAILGMSRQEIGRKFDSIVSFSGIEKFIDTPVKRYSSGQYVRLAFSVAVHTEPEILLVDEVLAVGDLAFQQKCLEHMKRLKQGGMTILLVSHNMTAIQSTCPRSIFLENGMVTAMADSVEVINRYRDSMRRRGEDEAQSFSAETGEPGVTIKSFEMIGEDGQPRRNFRFGEEVRIRIELEAAQRVEAPILNFGLRRGDGVIVCNFNNWYDGFKIDYLEGTCLLEGWLPPLRLIPHFYEIHVLVWPKRSRSHAEDDLSRLRPLAARRFGDFAIEGPPLTEEDGVFQQPARRWAITVQGRRTVFDQVRPDSLDRAYTNEASFDIEQREVT